MFSAIDITFVDLLDVIFVTLLIYWLIRIVRGTSATRIFAGIVLLYIVWVVARALEMKLLSFLFEQLLGVGVIALFVIFQPEIRRFLFRLSSKYPSAVTSNFLTKWFRTQTGGGMTDSDIDEIVTACCRMSETRTGALIVIQHGTTLEHYIQTGDVINANINRRLIENIFFKNTPLHDGAMIVSRSKIIAARCTLPMTDRQDIPPRFGMRHRASVGMSEQSDASVIVVSEETGEITFVSEGEMQHMADGKALKKAIEESYK